MSRSLKQRGSLQTAAENVPNNKILCIGTSITNSVGATSTATGYPALIQAKLPTLLPGLTYTVVAAGVNGNTSAEMLARLIPLLETHRPRFVFIETSINDTRDDRTLTPSDTDSNVRTMIGLVRASGATPIVGTSAPINSATYGAPYSAQSEAEALQANDLVRTATTALRVQLVDLPSMYNGVPTNLPDGIHPNDLGHDQWATNIARAIAARAAITFAGLASSDNFNRADNNTTLGVTPTGNFPWTIDGTGTSTPRAVFGIISNQAYPVSINAGGTGEGFALIDDRLSDFTMEATNNVKVNGGTGLMFRYGDTNNFLIVYVNGSGLWQLMKKVNGPYTSLATGPAAVAGDVVNIKTSGSTITVKINGTVQMSATDAHQSTSTRKGLWTGSTGGAARWDNFSTTA